MPRPAPGGGWGCAPGALAAAGGSLRVPVFTLAASASGPQIALRGCSGLKCGKCGLYTEALSPCSFSKGAGRALAGVGRGVGSHGADPG